MEKAKFQIPAKFKVLLEHDKRYRIYAFYGGRGGGKTQGCARAILALINSSPRPMRILNLREFQNSIEESTYQVYCNIINESGLAPNYCIYSDKIVSLHNNSEIIFKGIRGSGGKRTGQQIKSYEGFDICWVDEAQSLSKEQLDILLPTIRKTGSELWFTFNRLEEIDPIWTIVASGDDDIYLDKVNYTDNPFWTKELEAERLRCLANDRDNYDHIYLGEPQALIDDFVLFNKQQVEAAQKRETNKLNYLHAAKILGIDPARYGKDEAVWYLRQGCYATCLKVAKKTSVPQLVDITTELMNLHKPDMVFVDRGGEGGGVVDFVRQLGYKNICDIGFNDSSSNKRYYNKRAEMYCKLKDWLKIGQIPDDYDLRQELCNTKQIPKDDVIQLEDKAKIKARIGRSPGRADALALTFAKDVKNKTVMEQFEHRRNFQQLKQNRSVMM